MKLRLFPFSFLAACTTAGAPSEPVATVAAPIVGGTESDPAQDSAVLVMHYEAVKKGGGAASGCTGTLLTPRLVLTARHCVAITDSGAACNSEGEPIAGGKVEGDHDPRSIYVFGGRDRPDFLSGNVHPARGEEILSTGAKTLCDNDIALVLLDRPLQGGTIAPIRLEAKPSVGELVTVVGWGVADDDPDPDTRRQRPNVDVLDVGPADALGPNEFRVGEGTCQGDSGGPAFSAHGAVLGALSRGGNASGGKGADACIGGTNIFTSTAGHADFIRAGYAKAGQEPWIEGEPNPLLAKTGEACQADADCRSNRCDTERRVCADDCGTSECPSSFACIDQAGRKLCAPAPPPQGSDGCTTVQGSTPRPWFILAVLFACFCRKKSAKNERLMGSGSS